MYLWWHTPVSCNSYPLSYVSQRYTSTICERYNGISKIIVVNLLTYYWTEYYLENLCSIIIRKISKTHRLIMANKKIYIDDTENGTVEFIALMDNNSYFRSCVPVWCMYSQSNVMLFLDFFVYFVLISVCKVYLVFSYFYLWG